MLYYYIVDALLSPLKTSEISDQRPTTPMWYYPVLLRWKHSQPKHIKH